MVKGEHHEQVEAAGAKHISDMCWELQTQPNNCVGNGRRPLRPPHQNQTRLLPPLVSGAGAVVGHAKGYKVPPAIKKQHGGSGGQASGGATLQISSDLRQTASRKGVAQPTAVVPGPASRPRCNRLHHPVGLMLAIPSRESRSRRLG